MYPTYHAYDIMLKKPLRIHWGKKKNGTGAKPFTSGMSSMYKDKMKRGRLTPQ